MKKFFHYNTEPPESSAPKKLPISDEEWQQLSPGYRRAITREFLKNEKK